MIGSWFRLPHPTPRGSWGWEVVAPDGVTVTSGVAADETAARLDCQVAMVGARSEGRYVADVAQLPAPVSFGGRWAAAAA